MRSVSAVALIAALAVVALPARAGDARPNAPPLRAEPVLKPGDVITGTIRYVTTRHPNGTPLYAYQLVTPKPYTYAGDPDLCAPDQPLTTFHLIVTDNKKAAAALKRSRGKVRAIKAIAPMCSHTAWHIGDMVLWQWEFADKDR